MKSIGILGTRGIPASYGGFETAAEAIALGLRKAGFKVLVACEAGSSQCGKNPGSYHGIDLLYFPAKDSLRPLSEVLYDVRSLIGVGPRADAIYMMGYGAGFFFWIARIFRKTLVVNCDGMEWMRPKFGRMSRLMLRLSERMGLTTANVVVADSKCVAKYVANTYGRRPVFLAYGTRLASSPPTWNSTALERWRPGLSLLLKPDDYYLVLARMEPDNNIDKIMKGFTSSHTARKLILVGPCVSREYLSRLRNIAAEDPRILLAGPLYDPEVKAMLRWHCVAYLHGHMVGGTNPSLLEALGAGNVILCTDVEFNREVIGDQELIPSFYFNPDPASITQIIDKADPNLIPLRAKAREAGPARINQAYSWPAIVKGYESLFNSL